jgi:ribonucleotide reductase alpha subunit
VCAEFEELFPKYEATPGLARKTMPAHQLWNQVLNSQIEMGTPYMLYKDA